MEIGIFHLERGRPCRCIAIFIANYHLLWAYSVPGSIFESFTCIKLLQTSSKVTELPSDRAGSGHQMGCLCLDLLCETPGRLLMVFNHEQSRWLSGQEFYRADPREASCEVVGYRLREVFEPSDALLRMTWGILC